MVGYLLYMKKPLLNQFSITELIIFISILIISIVTLNSVNSNNKKSTFNDETVISEHDKLSKLEIK